MLVIHERELQCSATRFGRTQLLLRRSSVGVGAIGKAISPWRCSQSKLSSLGVKPMVEITYVVYARRRRPALGTVFDQGQFLTRLASLHMGLN